MQSSAVGVSGELMRFDEAEELCGGGRTKWNGVFD